MPSQRALTSGGCAVAATASGVGLDSCACSTPRLGPARYTSSPRAARRAHAAQRLQAFRHNRAATNQKASEREPLVTLCRKGHADLRRAHWPAGNPRDGRQRRPESRREAQPRASLSYSSYAA